MSSHKVVYGSRDAKLKYFSSSHITMIILFRNYIHLSIVDPGLLLGWDSHICIFLLGLIEIVATRELGLLGTFNWLSVPESVPHSQWVVDEILIRTKQKNGFLTETRFLSSVSVHACLGAQLEAGGSLGREARQTHPADTLIPNWELGKPAAMGLCIT